MKKYAYCPGCSLEKMALSYHKSSLDMLLLCYEKVDDSAKAEFTREEMRVFYPHHTPSEGGAAKSS